MALLTPEIVYRRTNVMGVPDSGAHNPDKDEIVQLLNLLFGVSRGGWVVARTIAELNGITPTNSTDGGVVLTGTGAGYYDRDGGAWVFGRGFPDTFAKVALSGSGTAQTGAVDAGVTPASIEVFFAKVATPNTGPLTLSISGGPARSVRNLAGNPLSAGEWTGMVMFYLNDANQYQLLIDAGAAASAAASASAAAQALADSLAMIVPDNGVTEVKIADAVTSARPYVLATRTAMKALAATGRYNVVFLSEPGREGMFVRKAGTPPSDLSEGLYVVSNTAGYYWQRVVESNIYHATWWGVLADDSTVNDTALQRAISGLPNITTTLILPSGTIRLSVQISIARGYLTIRGAGAAATTIRQLTNNVTTFYFAAAAPSSIQSITLADMGIGTISSITSTAGAAVYIEKGDGVWLQNLSFGGHFYEVYLAGCFGVHMDNCRGANGYTTPSTRSSILVSNANPSYGGSYGGNIFISNCDFRTAFGQGGTPGAKYGIEIGAVDGLFVSNSYFGYFSDAAVGIINAGGTIAGLKFSNCWFDHESGCGVYSMGGVAVSHHGGQFTGCSFVGGSAATYNYRAEGASQGIEITGCEFAWVNGDNIRINTSQGQVIVANNNLRLADNDNTAGGNGISIVGGVDFVISGNVINGESKSDQGISLTGGSEIVVNGNRVKNCIHGILTSGTVNGYIIQGNNCRGNSGSSVNDGSSGASKSVSGNL